MQGFRFTVKLTMVLMLAACGEGGSGSFPLVAPPKYDLTNTWYVTETRDAYVCDGSTVVDSPIYSLVQQGNTLLVTDETGGTGSFSARLEGDRLSWSRQYSAAGGTVDADFTGTAKNETCFNGTVRWVWSDNASRCVGNSSLSANTAAPSPDC